ncbi:MAG: 4-hydroxythreonine-4-phosphate dehydrogenase PdxA [Candidatus Parabeggiatoa sp. nov. 3]|jgi:4-hydroxythreonine-4-phosphate dehydrogenase|nr:MAG: 4-hydroxythreonine-4-phosphate dehydrogenase PdxA [Gammaproteobacteria bacterium]RKZ66200.1 MAG: 4-hydroxythreonine-4-phosphate dehydrogenase PdxA [Gammaproteobacteria bacterium]RKZ82346.1 MAG: 4-hydroxythreonine-4-phosphate dehydrogenase PdxA [Gammaproteobacteria bacterium]
MKKPFIAITQGDPAGIGPEIVVKSLSNPKVYEVSQPVVIGDKHVIANALSFCHKTAKIHIVQKPQDGKYELGTLDLIDLENIELSKLQIGTVQAMCGQAAYDYIEKAVKLAMASEVQALATTPINKESLRAAQIEQIGHTEILAELSQTRDPLTMFEVRGMRIFFLSRHVSLRQACSLVTKERVLEYIIRCTQALKKLGITEGTMAVAGLNPHSGEHGLFGDEEVNQVEPAVKEAQAQGYNVVGPIGADSVFHQTLQRKYNAVLSLYHDQGHIAAKTLDFEKTISITNGLPFLRTSVDHGTAFDIAGKGIASESGMTEAILLAAKYTVL